MRELTNLTVSELHSRGQRTVDFSGKFLAEIGKLQDPRETHRDSLKSNGSTMGQLNDAAAELSVGGVSTDPVKDASTELSVNGFNYRETAAD